MVWIRHRYPRKLLEYLKEEGCIVKREYPGIYYLTNNRMFKIQIIASKELEDKEKTEYGEGVYIGSDKSKWSTYAKECDYNVISGRTIGPDVAAEHFDIKEGTTGNIIEKNIMHGSEIMGENYADSFIDAQSIN